MGSSGPWDRLIWVRSRDHVFRLVDWRSQGLSNDLFRFTASLLPSQCPMMPFFIYYSMFGFQRVGDIIWQAPLGTGRTGAVSAEFVRWSRAHR